MRALVRSACLAAALSVACSKQDPAPPASSSSASAPAVGSGAASATATATESATATATATGSGAATETATATGSATATATASAHGPGKAVGTAKAAATCGDKPLPPCPLYAWMKANTSAAMSAQDFDALTTALAKVVTFAPPGYGNWASIARDGANAARSQNLDSVKASCRSCHNQYKDKYKKEMRDRAL